EHVMTRNQPGNGIRSHSPADRSRACWCIDCTRQLRVGRSSCSPKIYEGLPDFELKIRSTDAKPERTRWPFARSRPDRNGSRPSVLVVALEQRARPARSQRVLGCRFFSRVHERKMAEPARCRGQNRTPEGRIAEAEPDGGALTLEL